MHEEVSRASPQAKYFSGPPHPDECKWQKQITPPPILSSYSSFYSIPALLRLTFSIRPLPLNVAKPPTAACPPAFRGLSLVLGTASTCINSIPSHLELSQKKAECRQATRCKSDSLLLYSIIASPVLLPLCLPLIAAETRDWISWIAFS